VRESLYEVSYDTVDAGGGIASFDAFETYDVDPAASLAYESDSNSGLSKLSFTDDFTVEGFFKTKSNGASGHMTLVQHQYGNSFSYSIDLNKHAPGSVSFSIGPAPFPTVVVSNQTSTAFNDGAWHYFVARYDKEASGQGSFGKVALKVLKEDGSLHFGIEDVSLDFSISAGSDRLTVGHSFDENGSRVNEFIGYLDELRLSEGLLMDQDLLGLVSADLRNPSQSCDSDPVLMDASYGVITDGSGESEEYIGSQHCQWLISVPVPNAQGIADTVPHFVALTFTKFSTEPSADIVVVYDGDSKFAPVLGVFSGYNVPDTPIVSTGPKMLVTFISDGKQVFEQRGFEAKYASMSLSRTECATVNKGHELSLQCPSGFVITKVNFASFGTPTGTCSPEDLRTVVKAPESIEGSPYGAPTANGVNTGPIYFETGYCHSNSSVSVVERQCMGENGCAFIVEDNLFQGDPCEGIFDSEVGYAGVDDPDVEGLDAYPRQPLAEGYHGITATRMHVQVTCQGQLSFAENCAVECSDSGFCLYGLTAPHCSWCQHLGLKPTSDGAYLGEGCSPSGQFCVKKAGCTPKAETDFPWRHTTPT